MKKLIALLLVLLCLMPCACAAKYEPITLTVEEAAAANLFLSNFTETGVCNVGWKSPDIDLVDFAHDHMWFNSRDRFEFGEYFNGNNCRVSDEKIQEVIDKYFWDPWQVDLSETRYDYRDGYYYGCETGGFTPMGFAHVVSVVPCDTYGEPAYLMTFLVYGIGDGWDSSVYSMTQDAIEAEYADFAPGCGSALVSASDLSDRSTYRMMSYSRH